MTKPLYGAKCHLCSHLRHTGEHAAKPVWWLRRPDDVLLWCEDCSFCQANALIKVLGDAGVDTFDPEIRKAIQSLGNTDPEYDWQSVVLRALSQTTPQPGKPTLNLIESTWGPGGPPYRPGRIRSWLSGLFQERHYDDR